MYAPRGVDSDDDDERPMWVTESAPPARPRFSWKALISRSKKAVPQGAEQTSSKRTQQKGDLHKVDSAVKTLKKRVRILIEGEDHPDGQQDAAKPATAPEEAAIVPASAASAGTIPAPHSATPVKTPDRSVELLREFIALTRILMEFYRLTKTPTAAAHPSSNTHSEQISSHPSYPGSVPLPPIDGPHDPCAPSGTSTLPFGPDGPMQAAALPANHPLHGLNAAYYQSFPSNHEQQQGAPASRPPHMSDANIRNGSSGLPRQDRPNHLAPRQDDYRTERAAASVNPRSGRNGIKTYSGQAQVDQERDLQILTAKLKGWAGRRQEARRHLSDNVDGEVPVDLIDCIKAVAHCIVIAAKLFPRHSNMTTTGYAGAPSHTGTEHMPGHGDALVADIAEVLKHVRTIHGYLLQTARSVRNHSSETGDRDSVGGRSLSVPVEHHAPAMVHWLAHLAPAGGWLTPNMVEILFDTLQAVRHRNVGVRELNAERERIERRSRKSH